MTEHPQRCETCKFYKYDEYTGMNCTLKNDMYGLSQWYIKLIERVGCASHSASEPGDGRTWPQVASDAYQAGIEVGNEEGASEGREKMVEDIYKRLTALYETVGIHQHYRRILVDSDIECLFAELRESLQRKEGAGSDE